MFWVQTCTPISFLSSKWRKVLTHMMMFLLFLLLPALILVLVVVVLGVYVKMVTS